MYELFLVLMFLALVMSIVKNVVIIITRVFLITKNKGCVVDDQRGTGTSDT